MMSTDVVSNRVWHHAWGSLDPWEAKEYLWIFNILLAIPLWMGIVE